MKTIRAEIFAAKFIQHNCCGARALRALGVKGSVQSLSTQAAQLLKKLEVRKSLHRPPKEMAMNPYETSFRIPERTTSIIDDSLDRNGRLQIGKPRLRV